MDHFQVFYGNFQACLIYTFLYYLIQEILQEHNLNTIGKEKGDFQGGNSFPILHHHLLFYSTNSYSIPPSPILLRHLLFYSAISYSTPPSPILLHHLLFYSTISYSTPPSPILLHHLLFYSTISYSTLLSFIALHHLLFYSTISYSTLIYFIALHHLLFKSTISYSTILSFIVLNHLLFYGTIYYCTPPSPTVLEPSLLLFKYTKVAVCIDLSRFINYNDSFTAEHYYQWKPMRSRLLRGGGQITLKTLFFYKIF